MARISPLRSEYALQSSGELVRKDVADCRIMMISLYMYCRLPLVTFRGTFLSQNSRWGKVKPNFRLQKGYNVAPKSLTEILKSREFVELSRDSKVISFMSARAQVLHWVSWWGPGIWHARGRARSLEEVLRGRRANPGHWTQARRRTQATVDR